MICKTTVITVAIFTMSLQYHFLEVDHTQSMKENRIKIERYNAFHDGGLIAQSLKHFPVVVWLTTTDHRGSN